MGTKRVAIIGAGPSGLSQLRAFKAAADKGAQIPEIVCFEKQATWGGLWNLTWRTGSDEFGETCHNSMYRYQWSNSPKECLEFGDYSFEEHFGQQIESFPPRAVLEKYIKGRADKSGFKDWIRFSSPVRMVKYCDDSAKFTVTVHDHVKDIVYSEEFDNVIVATGHFSFPDTPTFAGIETFTGRILHSHDFRDAAQFRGQKVLVIGRSYSAEDIASQCYKYGAEHVTVSYRSKPTGIHWPTGINEVPLLQRVNGSTCHFLDGTSVEYDVIIYCTGYLHKFPFLPENLRLKTKNRYWPLNLYQGVIWEANPRLMYVGMQDQCYSFTLFDAQAWYVRDVILGRIKLPSKADMEKHTLEWREKEEKIAEINDTVWFQGEYVKQLIDATDYPNLDTQLIGRTFIEWLDYKHGDIMGYRDRSHRSTITGTMGVPVEKAWMENKEDFDGLQPKDQ